MNRSDPKNVIPITPAVAGRESAPELSNSFSGASSPLLSDLMGRSLSSGTPMQRPPNDSPIPVTPPRLFYELESIFVTVRQVEARLLEEQEKLRVAQKDLFQERSLREAELKQSRARAAELSEIRKRLKGELEARQKDEETLNLQVKSLQGRLNAAQGELDLLKARLDDEKRRALMDQEQTKYALGREQKRYKSLEDEYRRAYAANENLQAEIRKQLTQSIEREESLKTQNAELTARKLKVEERLSQLQGELSGLKIEFEKLRQERHSKEHSLKVAEAELQRYRAAWSEAVSRDQQMRAKLLNVNEVYGRLKEQLAVEVEKVTSLRDAWEKERNRTRVYESELQELKSRNAILEEETVSVARALKNAEGEAVRVTEEADRTKAILIRKLREADEQVNALAARLNSLERRWEAEKQSTQDMESQGQVELTLPAALPQRDQMSDRIDQLEREQARAAYEREKLAYHAEKLREHRQRNASDGQAAKKEPGPSSARESSSLQENALGISPGHLEDEREPKLEFTLNEPALLEPSNPKQPPPFGRHD